MNFFRVSVLCLLAQVFARNVVVDVKAPWKQYTTSIIAELAEFMGDQSNSLFWQYVNALCAESSRIESALLQGSDEAVSELQSIAFEVATNVAPASLHALMDTTIGLGANLPAVQFYNSLTESILTKPCGAEAFAIDYSNGKIICSNEATTTTIELSVNNLPKLDGAWDHLFPFQLPSTTIYEHRHLALYGTIGTASFCSLHKSIIDEAEKDTSVTVQYGIRHAFHNISITGNSARVQGYGVFLDIKNVEYKTGDDASPSAAGGASAAEGLDEKDSAFAPGEEIAGVILSTLAERRPHLVDELSLLRAELTNKVVEEGSEMKMWQVKELGLQTLAAVMTASSPVDKLTDIVSNFPLHAPPLSAVKLSESFRNEFGEDSIWQRGAGSKVYLNTMYLNGIRVDLGGATFNIYDLLQQVHQELTQLEQLQSLHLTPALQAGLRQAAMKLSSESDDSNRGQSITSIVRIDVSKGGKHVVHFMNNLEKDRWYKSWPKKLSTLLTPSWEMHTVARNIYTFIVIANPVEQAGADALLQLQSMHQQRYPIRVGFVLYCGKDSAAPDSLLVRVCRLFAHAKTYGTEEATNFVMELAGEVSKHAANSQMTGVPMNSEEILTEPKLSRIYCDAIIAVSSKTKYAHELVAEAKSIQLGTVNTETSQVEYQHQDFITNSTVYLQARGLPVNTFSLNGIVLPMEAMTEGLMQLIGRELYLLVMAVRSGQLTDKSGSVFNAILEMNPGRTYARYHRLLEESAGEYVDLAQPQYHSLTQTSQYFYDVSVAGEDDQQAILASVGFISSVHVLATITENGLRSVSEALGWIRNKSRGDSHRMAVAFLLSDSETQCLSLLVNQISRLTSPADAVKLIENISSVCGDISSEVDLKLLQRAIAMQIALANAVCTSTAMEVGVDGSSKGSTVAGDATAGLCTRDDLSAFATGTPVPSIVGVPLNTIQSGLHIMLQRSVVGKQAVGWSDGSQTESTDANESSKSKPASGCNDTDDVTVVFYNGRKVRLWHGYRTTSTTSKTANKAKMDMALAHEDLTLLSTIEYNRLGSGLDEALTAHPPLDRATASLSANAEQYLKLANFIGLYGGNSGIQRSDVAGGLLEGGVILQQGAESHASKKKPTKIDEKSLAYGTLQLHVAPSMESTGSSSISVIYLIDPLSVAGQRAVALIKLFRDSLKLSQTVILAPRRELVEFPLQNFYRYVVAPHSGRSSNTGSESALTTTTEGAAVFRSLPKKHTLTIRIDGPEPWNIQAAAASQDIDNLQCKLKSSTSTSDNAPCGDINAAGVATDITAVSYSLKNILFTGSCTQTIFGQPHQVPPNGLQLTFTRTGYIATDSPSISSSINVNSFETTDTLVMQNLGYFQLQANPGLWDLNLATGRARYLYDFHGGSNADTEAQVFGETDPMIPSSEIMLAGSNADHMGKLIAVKSFSNVFYRLVVHKRAGLESTPLLQDANDDSEDEFDGSGGMWDSLTSFFGDGKSKKSKGGSASSSKKKLVKANSNDDDNRIHVFSLATGHMYERLLRIMMLSVTKRTSVPVKFWLLENYLSPTFKEIVALMSQKYGFEVGYVTYKWPEWLRQQTQKQRIIWGYKILFLDVLFPLHVKKVIYVDADQVLRADLKELWDLDLKGKPYAYTPFCTSRAETLGFQFWRSGYWADHLRGKPYHISALYVVDLQKFRRNAVGDTLRGVYDGLARDPNSLANLDQDLPNYAQHSVPIHSLPQSWLWCETWCSDESKAQAKTIDLCNNPLHKEPKLDMARRVVSGKLFNESWVQLDDEIRQLEIAGGFRRAD